MKTVTTKELTSMTGLIWGTLNQYVCFGWLEPPQITSYGKGNGRGSRLLWPENTVKRVEQIQTYKKMGLTLAEIDNVLGESQK